MSADTIAAISSAVGPVAARVIVRLSGPATPAITNAVCDPSSDAPSAARTTLRLANLACPAWLYRFRAPASYTGEDLSEFHLPGNALLAKLLLDELQYRGARLAEPGEFTSRAFLAGKMDLTAAEGVAAVIAAANAAQLAAARQLLAGELARRLAGPMEQLAEMLARVEAGIDFADEGIEFVSAGEIHAGAAAVLAQLSDLLAGSDRFELLVHEPRIVLLGRPNAGKSTLINALTGTPRALVSPTAGTTRDVLSAPLDLPRGRVMLVDVAGIAAAESDGTVQDQIDRQAQAMAQQAASSAQHVVLVRELHDRNEQPPLPRPADLVVVTKADQGQTHPADTELVVVSAHTGAGLAALRVALDRLAFGTGGGAVRLALTARHVAAIADAHATLQRIVAGASPLPAELLAAELRSALDALGRVLGHVSPDDILGRIFSSFCIGK
jgi:tRNA modification GTPase